jgi:hypothetical protein
LQLEAHRIENIKSSREVRFYGIARKCPVKARPRQPRFLRKVRNTVQAGGGANGMTNSSDIRFFNASLIRSAAACWEADCGRVAGMANFSDM